MTKIRNLFLLLIILIAASVGGLKWLIHYYTEKTAQEIQSTLPPGMFIYRGVSSSLEGYASIDDISLNIAGEKIKIAKIELVTKNIFETIQLITKYWINDKAIPTELSIHIKGINIKTSTLMDRNFPLSQFKSIHALEIPCGNIKSLGYAEYVSMGYHDFTFDTKLAYKITTSNRLQLDLEFDAPTVSRTRISYYGNFTIPSTSEISVQNLTIQIAQSLKYLPSININIDKNVFQKNVYNFCALKEKKSLPNFINSLNNYTKSKLDPETIKLYGIVLDKTVVDALHKYEKSPKAFYFGINPKGSISPAELKNMQESVVVDLLRPKLMINGNNVPISFKWSTYEQLLARKKPTPAKKPITISSERFPVSFDQVSKYAFNKNLEVMVASGIVYTGAFRRVVGDSLYMDIRTKNGFSEINLRKDFIRRIYVLSPY